MFKWDLKEGYFHVSLDEQASNLCGIEWAGKFFRYTVLPFGCSLSPISFPKVTEKGRSDGRKPGRFHRDEYRLPLLQNLGLVLEPSKSTLEPVQRVEMLGLVKVHLLNATS